MGDGGEEIAEVVVSVGGGGVWGGKGRFEGKGRGLMVKPSVDLT